jgi:hypothetical protein
VTGTSSYRYTSGLYVVFMRYQSQAYDQSTNDLAADLGQWESKREAQSACVSHANEALSWEERWRGRWEAHAEVHWYRVSVTPE